MPSVEQNALKFLEIGYQRELSYKHNDGSYSAFGMSDARGSTWLTAYVARSFQQAKKYSDIDTKLIAMALDFLATQQTKNGSFQELGRLVDFSHQNVYALSAFVMLAFQEDKVNSCFMLNFLITKIFLILNFYRKILSSMEILYKRA